ncbi:MAG: NAD(P)-dependent alcohol dehydrogenase [Phycisphaeraceae bacterium]|nr:NAD(P)-dependent alcohol dehydrogenase [Phycisphaeraceae bacterium]MCW5755072.1 NAD(P)-dependent alcohol dehydrogenase [Phycisphaeraceae bacterium]
MTTRAFAAQSATSPLAPMTIQRRDPLPTDVEIDILYCGVCHSDLHFARNEWGMTEFPIVPGHEILGRVTRVGSEVTRFKVGDLAAVGCLVDSCRTCSSCGRGLEQFCTNGATFTYGAPDKISGGMTHGGYSERIVCAEAFTLKVPSNLDPARAAPLLCAGITTYSPLRKWGATRGKKVGIVGLGGLGHMGVKFAHALGAHTVLFTTSEGKVADGRRLGADEVVISKNADAMAAHAGSFDLIIDTVSADHDLNAYLALLKLDAALVLVGVPPSPQPVHAFSLLMPRRTLAGSLIGGIAETQEMLDFCGNNGIVCDIELIRMQQINEAYERMLKSDVKYRFVIDMASLKG